jgi:hypothetical protein
LFNGFELLQQDQRWSVLGLIASDLILDMRMCAHTNQAPSSPGRNFPLANRIWLRLSSKIVKNPRLPVARAKRLQMAIEDVFQWFGKTSILLKLLTLFLGKLQKQISINPRHSMPAGVADSKS